METLMFRDLMVANNLSPSHSDRLGNLPGIFKRLALSRKRRLYLHPAGKQERTASAPLGLLQNWIAVELPLTGLAAGRPLQSVDRV